MDETGAGTSGSGGAVHTSWKGYWTNSDTVDIGCHELAMELFLQQQNGNESMIIQGTGRHWPEREEAPKANKRRRKECFELNQGESNFRQRVDAVLHQHSEDFVLSTIEGTVQCASPTIEAAEGCSPNSSSSSSSSSCSSSCSSSSSSSSSNAQFVEMTQRWKASPEDTVDEGEEGEEGSRRVQYWGFLDLEAECIVGFRSRPLLEGEPDQRPPAFVKSRPDHFCTSNGRGKHPWDSSDYHPFKLTFTRNRNFSAFSRLWKGHWRFELERFEYDTTVEVSVSPDGMICGFGSGHSDITGVAKANEFVIYGCVDQSLHFTWRKIYDTRCSDYRGCISDFKEQIAYFDALRNHLLAEVKLPRDVCWTVFELLGAELNGQWDNVFSGRVGPFRLSLPVIPPPDSPSLADKLSVVTIRVQP